MITFSTISPIYLSENPILINATTSDATTTFIALEVYIDGDLVGARLHAKPQDGAVSIDIHTMIHAQLIEQYQSIVVIEEDYRIRKPAECVVKAAEVIAGVTGSFTDATPFFVMLGKVETDDFYQAFNNSNAFLTTYPNREEIGVNSPQFLTYFNHTAATLTGGFTNVIAVGTYTDGTTATAYKAIGETLEQYDCLIINVNPEKLGLVTDNLRSYKLYVLHDGVQLSENRYYTIRATPDYYNDVLYFNEYYAPHTLRLTGDWATGLKTDYSRYQTEEGYDQTTQNDTTNIRAKGGFFSQAQSKALKALYKRGKLFHIEGDFATLLLLDKKKWKITSAFKFLYIINLTMTIAQKKQETNNRALHQAGFTDIPTPVVVGPGGTGGAGDD